MTEAPTLADAIAHLKGFRASWNTDDEIDKDSHLTARALDVIIAHAEATIIHEKREDDIIDKLGDLA